MNNQTFSASDAHILLNFVAFVARNFKRPLNHNLESYAPVRELIKVLEPKAINTLLGDTEPCGTEPEMSGHDFLKIFRNTKLMLAEKDELIGFVPEVPNDPDQVERLNPVTVIDALLPIPPQPDLVVLGQGGTFRTNGKKFDGYTWQPSFCIQNKHAENWSPSIEMTGKSQAQFYAAKWDSEVAQLNGHTNPLIAAELKHGPL